MEGNGVATRKHCSASMPCSHSSALGEQRSRHKQAVLLATAARSYAQGEAACQQTLMQQAPPLVARFNASSARRPGPALNDFYQLRTVGVHLLTTGNASGCEGEVRMYLCRVGSETGLLPSLDETDKVNAKRDDMHLYWM